MNHGRILAMGSLNDLARKLWPVTWVDIMFHVKPADDLDDRLMGQRGVRQIVMDPKINTLSVQVENDEVIPDVVRLLVEQGSSILRVNPRAYTLEDIYFTLQAGES
jgi:ABC-type multidrug transport system ATPase subunit